MATYLDNDGNPINGAAPVAAPIAAPLPPAYLDENGNPSTTTTGSPPRSDVRGSVAFRNRPANAPPTATGDPRGDISTLPHPIALLEGVANALGIPTSIPRSPGELMRAAVNNPLIAPVTVPYQSALQLYDTVKQHHADIKRGYSAPVAGGRAALNMVPFGGTANELLSPAAATLSGQPVTAEQNTDALRGATTAATMAIAPKAISKVAGVVSRTGPAIRSRGVSALNAALRSADKGGITDSIAKGQNPADALVRHMPELPSEPEAASKAVSAKMDELHDRAQQHLQSPELSQRPPVPEATVREAVMRPALRSALGDVKESSSIPANVRAILMRRDPLSNANYTTLRDLAKTQPSALPPEVNAAIGRLETMRGEHGSLDLTPDQLNQSKADLYAEIKRFKGPVSGTDMSLNDLRRGQAQGLRQLVDEHTAGLDGSPSPVTALNRDYGGLAAAKNAFDAMAVADKAKPFFRTGQSLIGMGAGAAAGHQMAGWPGSVAGGLVGGMAGGELVGAARGALAAPGFGFKVGKIGSAISPGPQPIIAAPPAAATQSATSAEPLQLVDEFPEEEQVAKAAGSIAQQSTKPDYQAIMDRNRAANLAQAAGAAAEVEKRNASMPIPAAAASASAIIDRSYKPRAAGPSDTAAAAAAAKSAPEASSTAATASPGTLGPGTTVSTPKGKGTVTHTVTKPSGERLHFVDGVETESGRTVVVEQPSAKLAGPKPLSKSKPKPTK